MKPSFQSQVKKGLFGWGKKESTVSAPAPATVQLEPKDSENSSQIQDNGMDIDTEVDQENVAPSGVHSTPQQKSTTVPEEVQNKPSALTESSKVISTSSYNPTVTVTNTTPPKAEPQYKINERYD